MSISKKFTAMAMALCLALAMLPGAALAVVTGSGIDADPYIVTSSDELTEAVNLGGVIKVTGIIDNASKVEINNNAVTIIGDNAIINSSAEDLFTVTGTGSLTLGEGLSVNSNTTILAAVSGGKIIVDGAAIKSTGASNILGGAVHAGSTITIKSGSVEQTTAQVPLLANGGTINVEGGSVTASGGSATSAIGAIGGGTVNISGGTVTTEGTMSAVYAYNNTGTTPSTLSISGGTVSAPNSGSAVSSSMKGQTTITGGTVEGLIKKQDDGTLSVTGGTFTENPSAYVDSSAAAATVTSGSTTTYAVGNDSIQKAAEGGGKVEVTQGSVNIESTKLPEGTTIIAKGGTVTVDSNPVGDTGYTKPAAPKPSSGGYSGPEVRYVGGNTFEATTSEAPREVRIDGQPVSFTMNGNRITVSGMPSGASRVTVSWGSSTFSTNFRPDAAAYSGSSVTIPKTGGASVTAYAIMALAAAAGILRRK